MFYQRKIYPDIKEHLQYQQISVITGMRRTGKTTIIKQILKEIESANKLYIDLERLDNRELFSEKNYDNIMRALSGLGLDLGKKIYLAIDEVQLLPEIASALKYIYDNYNIKIIATGSSSYYLKDLFSESLSGRKKIFELYPLDFSEYLTFKKVKYKPLKDLWNSKFDKFAYEQLRQYYEDYIEFGGFPEVVLSSSIKQKKDLLLDIISSYVNIDIKALSDFRKEKDIFNLLKLLSVRTGTRLDYSKLSRSSGLSRPTVMSYLEFFEKTYLIRRIPVHSNSPDREIVKARKLYFLDNGLAGVLSDLDGGTKFENAVFNQLRSHGKICYYALKNGREIDFVLNDLGLEAKETPIKDDRKNLDDLCQKANLSSGRLIGRLPSPSFDDYIWGGLIL
jgi:predicted AAA+ superfamily ATPase